MFDALITGLVTPVHLVIHHLHYAGVALLMAIESANIPLPSELILPYAGYLVQQGSLNFHGAAFAGAFGCVLGSLPSYALGAWGGRPFMQKYGRFLLLSEHDLEKGERWVDHFGNAAFFLCRMLPVVRTFISFPAGVLRAPLMPFIILTFLGSLIWSYALVYVGVLFGNNLVLFKRVWHQFDMVIVAIIGGMFLWYLWKHLRPMPHPPSVRR